jgi:hypothetical protein
LIYIECIADKREEVDDIIELDAWWIDNKFDKDIEYKVWI